jgi:hypothetical protein
MYRACLPLLISVFVATPNFCNWTFVLESCTTPTKTAMLLTLGSETEIKKLLQDFISQKIKEN